MGRYLGATPQGDELPAKGKAGALVAAGAIVLDSPISRAEWIPEMVCVVDNGPLKRQPTATHRKRWNALPDRTDVRKHGYT